MSTMNSIDLAAIRVLCNEAKTMAGWESYDLAVFAYRARTDLLDLCAVIEHLVGALETIGHAPTCPIGKEWVDDVKKTPCSCGKDAALALVTGGARA